jgi:hypothetical protein
MTYSFEVVYPTFSHLMGKLSEVVLWGQGNSVSNCLKMHDFLRFRGHFWRSKFRLKIDPLGGTLKVKLRKAL